MTHRIMCIGDIHLKHGHRRNADRLTSLDQIIGEGLCVESLAAWIVLGDVFDTRSSIEDRNELAPRLQRMANAAPVLIVAGNHDAPGDLDVLGKLKAAHPITVATRASLIELDLPTGARAAIVAIPYPHKHGLVGAGIPNHQIGAVAAQLLDAMVLELAAQLDVARESGALPLVAGHATIAGSVSSVGQPMGLDGDIAISEPLLDRLGDAPKIFGHIHAPQELYGAHYAGSISANDYGEVERKRYLVVEYFDEDYQVTSHPIVTPPMYHVEGTFTRAAGFTWEVKRGPDGEPLEMPASWKGADVRVRYRFQDAEASAFDKAQILAEFAETRSLELEPITIRERAHRAPEVEAAKTLPEKVAAFVRASGIAWSPALDAKLAALQDPDGEGFLRRVHHELSGVVPEEPVTAADSSSSRSHAVPDSDLFEEVRV